MHPADQEKIAFITDQWLYCYKVMSFGLKNAGATFLRLLNKMFREQIGRNMEDYVDDMLVKSMLMIDDECQIVFIWTPLFMFVKPLALLLSNIFAF